MLKWVVKSGHSPLNDNQIVKNKANNNHQRQSDDREIEESHSNDFANYEQSSSFPPGSKLNITDNVTATDSNMFGSVCHGFNSDSGIYANSSGSSLDDSFSANDDHHSTHTLRMDSSGSTNTCTADEIILTDTSSVGTCSLDFSDVKSGPRHLTRSLDLDHSFDLTDEDFVNYEIADDRVILGGNCIAEDSEDDVFVTADNGTDRLFYLRQQAPRLSSEDLENQANHQKKSNLIEQIERETKLKLGAENLLKATDNRDLKQTVEVELKVIQSHIKQLTDQLSDLDTAMETSNIPLTWTSKGFPMIHIELKQTKDVDFHYALKNFIEDHYFEDGKNFEKEIEDFEALRQTVKQPPPTEEGITLLYQYYNHLHYVDKRFFPPGKGIGVYFPWLDAVSGVLKTQRTMGFEKGCVLFNIAALYSQVAAQKSRSDDLECLEAAELLRKGAGALKYLHDNFSYAPSTDMQAHTLKILTHLLLTQSQECVLEKLLQDTNTTVTQHTQFAQESALVCNMYKYAHQLMQFDCVRDYLPQKWQLLVQVKSLYYKAMCNHHAALAILGLEDSRTDQSQTLCDMFDTVTPGVTQSPSVTSKQNGSKELDLRMDEEMLREDKKHLAKACLSRSVLVLEEALRVHCQQKIKRIPHYHNIHRILKASHDKCLQKFSDVDEEDDFTELLSVPNIKGKTVEVMKPIPPEFTHYKVEDPFHRLGPLTAFSARHSWSCPQRVVLSKKEGEEFGFSVRGERPVIVSEVEEGSIAQGSDIKLGDYIIQIDSLNVKWHKHSEVVELIRAAGQNLVLSLVTPQHKNYHQQAKSNNSSDENRNNISTLLGKKQNNNKKNSKTRHVMQSGTLDRKAAVRLSGRSTKSLTFTLRRLKLSSHPAVKDVNEKRHVKDLLKNWDSNRNKH